jgi:hypothetical protein
MRLGASRIETLAALLRPRRYPVYIPLVMCERNGKNSELQQVLTTMGDYKFVFPQLRCYTKLAASSFLTHICHALITERVSSQKIFSSTSPV